jgi:hypothetical protein
MQDVGQRLIEGGTNKKPPPRPIRQLISSCGPRAHRALVRQLRHFLIPGGHPPGPHVLSIECVLYRGLVSIECVLYRLCSLSRCSPYTHTHTHTHTHT